MNSSLPTQRRPIDLKELTKLNGLSISAGARCHWSHNEEFTVADEVTCLLEERVTGFPFSSAFILPKHASIFPPKKICFRSAGERSFFFYSRFGTYNQSGINFERSKMWSWEWPAKIVEDFFHTNSGTTLVVLRSLYWLRLFNTYNYLRHIRSYTAPNFK